MPSVPASPPTPPAAWRDMPLGLRVSRDREFSAPIYQHGPLTPLAAPTLDAAVTEARAALWPAGSTRDANAGVALLRRGGSSGPFFATGVCEYGFGGRSFTATLRANDPGFEWWIGGDSAASSPDVVALINRTDVVASATP